jgi:hypothetical protein
LILLVECSQGLKNHHLRRDIRGTELKNQKVIENAVLEIQVVGSNINVMNIRVDE